MTESSIPVDLFNPGQVFACLGFLEAADEICGNAEGGFDWSDEADVKFRLLADGQENPFAVVLEFLVEATIEPVKPNDVFPSIKPKTSSALPVQITGVNKKEIVLDHWADGSSRNDFKLYAGNRSALDIASAMLSGKPGKTKGIAQLWKEDHDQLIKHPFDVPTPMGGSFNFDPLGGWVAIDAGYSPDDQNHEVAASPVIELLAAWGLENARPDEYQTRKVRYSVWEMCLPPILARVALFGGVAAIPTKCFHFELHLAGKNKIVTYAEQEI